MDQNVSFQARAALAIAVTTIDAVTGHQVMDDLGIPQVLFGRRMSMDERLEYLRGMLSAFELLNQWILPVVIERAKFVGGG